MAVRLHYCTDPDVTFIYFIFLIITSVFKNVVWMSYATASVNTVQIPRLAEKYTATEWAWLQECGYALKRVALLLHGRGCPLVVHYWADLQSGHGLRCYGNITRTLVLTV